ncbi:bifunctional nuclease family protein [Yimella sp. cx-51]|uniref:bifunctional nuclease family protein n=1 Tax=Yimella sp. cx-51 TaxID=2770551 RepID=UPI00165E46DF|nr:bifunctional nuclease family protein [Yimella sp. cx-51]MBC9957779.1 bifunctional nuclease family protein [Yimella sp. cx-51]QTH36878.1 bifunctional nuclease family protein [Yimella sp. cx-51]
MKQVEVLGVRVEMPTNKPIVILRETASGRCVPIWIGAPEAAAIAHVLEGVEPPRPLTHDLMLILVDTLGARLSHVDIVSMDEGVFYAELVLADGRRIDARSSDAIALALRAGTAVYVDDTILDEVGVVMEMEQEDEVEKFREFLDQVSAEDFETAETDEKPDDRD